MYYNPQHWLSNTAAIQGTVIPRIWKRCLLFISFTLGVNLFKFLSPENFPSLSISAHLALGSLMSFLLVLRTNSAYDRFWEGRKLWGQLINTSRNLIRASTYSSSSQGQISQLIPSFALCLKQRLRGNNDFSDLDCIITNRIWVDKIKGSSNPPLAVTMLMTEWISNRFTNCDIELHLAQSIEGYVAQLIDIQGGCERIRKTPLPYAYTTQISQFILIYLLTISFPLVDLFHWYSLIVIAFMAFGTLGLDAAGVEIEDPFGDDLNDLPLDSFCQTIHDDAKEGLRLFGANKFVPNPTPLNEIGSFS